MLKRDRQAVSLCRGVEEELSGKQSHLYFDLGEPG